MKKSQKLTALILVMTSAFGCAPESKQKKDQIPAQELIGIDLNEMQRFNPTGAIAINQKYADRFSKIFGGVSGSNITHYYHERVRFTYSEKYLFDLGAIEQSRLLPPEFLGVNLNANMWIPYLRDGRTTDDTIDGRSLGVTGPQQGFVITGPGYKERNDHDQPIPTQIRQAVLIHEARHSDCTGGIPESKKAEFIANGTLKDNLCMHNHSICPGHHELEGQEACDDHPWGAYALGSIYAAALMLNNNTPYDQEALEAFFIDQGGRLVGFTLKDLMNGKLGEPDMSSAGVIP